MSTAIRWPPRGFTFGRERVLPMAVAVGLVVLGSALPYLRMEYLNQRIEQVEFRSWLLPSAQFARGMEPLHLPAYFVGLGDRLEWPLTVFSWGSSLHQIGAVVTVVLCWVLFADEINKFFFWPLHIAGWMLALAPVPLLIGLRMLHQTQVVVGLGPGWVPLTLAGVVVVVTTLRERRRIDSYGGI